MTLAKFTPEQVEAAATRYRTGEDPSWWPECPQVFRDEWKQTADMLAAYAELLRQTAREANLSSPVGDEAEIIAEQEARWDAKGT